MPVPTINAYVFTKRLQFALGFENISHETGFFESDGVSALLVVHELHLPDDSVLYRTLGSMLLCENFGLMSDLHFYHAQLLTNWINARIGILTRSQDPAVCPVLDVFRLWEHRLSSLLKEEVNESSDPQGLRVCDAYPSLGSVQARKRPKRMSDPLEGRS